MIEFEGKCYCDEVHYTLSSKPLFVQICHCNKCREMASESQNPQDKIGYSPCAAYLKKDFHITKGEDKLKETPKNNALLYSCKACGSQIYGMSKDVSQQEGIGINFNTIVLPTPTPEAFKPSRHVYFDFHKVKLEDELDKLPKFADMPIELGGSGKLYSLKNKISSKL